jgi:hypothetical protein
MNYNSLHTASLTTYNPLYYRLLKIIEPCSCIKLYIIYEFKDTSLFFSILDLINTLTTDKKIKNSHIINKLVYNNDKTIVNYMKYLIPNNDFILTIQSQNKKFYFYIRYEVNKLKIYTKHIDHLKDYLK